MEKKSNFRFYKIIMLIVLVAFITFLITSIGFYQYIKDNGKNAIIIDSLNKNELGNIFEKYRKIIEKYYLGEIDDEKLKQGAIKGYIKGLEDEYTEYLTKEEMDDYMEETNR